AGRDITHDDLLAGRRGLGGADVAVPQQEEGLRVRPLRENGAVLVVTGRAGLAQYFLEVLRLEAPEQRQMRNQRCVDLVHSVSLALGSVMAPAIVGQFAIA